MCGGGFASHVESGLGRLAGVSADVGAFPPKLFGSDGCCPVLIPQPSWLRGQHLCLSAVKEKCLKGIAARPTCNVPSPLICFCFPEVGTATSMKHDNRNSEWRSCSATHMRSSWKTCWKHWPSFINDWVKRKIFKKTQNRLSCNLLLKCSSNLLPSIFLQMLP